MYGCGGKDGLGLQVQPSFGRQRSLQPRCWLSLQQGAPSSPWLGTAPHLPHSESMGGPPILGRPSGPHMGSFAESQTPICSFLSRASLSCVQRLELLADDVSNQENQF